MAKDRNWPSPEVCSRCVGHIDGYDVKDESGVGDVKGQIPADIPTKYRYGTLLGEMACGKEKPATLGNVRVSDAW